MLDKAGSDASHGNRWRVFAADLSRGEPSPTSPTSFSSDAGPLGDEDAAAE
jgi:hypothetical protein